MHTHSIELLEPRIAPAVMLVSPFIGTYTDEDGDIVNVRFSKPLLTTGNVASIIATTPTGVGDHLDKIDLNGLIGASGTDIFVVTRVAGNGDGLANVGIIDATGVDLGAVQVHGDLGQILAGDSATDTRGMRSLAVHSFGIADTVAGTPPGGSDVLGFVGSLTVGVDMIGASFRVGAAAVADARIGSVFIGG